VGEPYLLAPIAAAVLGGTAMSGGIGSMVAVAGAALFLTQLGQVLQMLGLSSALQFVIEGIAIALGMAFSRLNFTQWAGPKNSIWRRKQNADGVGSKVAGENPFAVVNRHHRPPAI
jgi:ribose/xylose/arabinose/galactoside ABC-type transport system permease subunit